MPELKLVKSLLNFLDPLSRTLELHAPLSDDEKSAIQGLAHRVRNYEAGAYIVWEGDKPSQCDVLISGFAYRQKQTSDGKRQILSLIVPGDPLSFENLFLDVADHSVQMLTHGQTATIERDHLQAVMQAFPNLARAIVTHRLVESSISREWVLNLGRRDARARLAHLLCEFAVRLEAVGQKVGDVYDLPITQEQLADALGLTPVHVNRTLRSLESLGFITRHRRGIAFSSWQRMREVADFNQRYLHHRSAA